MHTNLHIPCQIISLDQDYDQAFERLVGELKMGADWLSHLKMSNTIPQHVLNKIYATNKIDHNYIYDIKLLMILDKTEQDKDKKLQKIFTELEYNYNFGTITFGNHDIHTFDSKVAVPPSLHAKWLIATHQPS